MHGALLVNKPQDLTSFGVIEALQIALRETRGIKRRDLPKMGHGGTLDPFATGLLVVCVGDAVKLSRYFLGSKKSYAGTMRFGETTIPGDPTAPISETSDVLPTTLEALQKIALSLTRQDYLQTPPMHSAKKHEGRALYELAREGKEIDREAVLCRLYEFSIESLSTDRVARADFKVSCSSGTYIRTLAQDLGRLVGSVGMLERLERTASGAFSLAKALSLSTLLDETRKNTPWDELSAWVPFDLLLDHFPKAEATPDECLALINGRQNVVLQLLPRVDWGNTTQERELFTIYHRGQLKSVAARDETTGVWSIQRVFTRL